MPAQARFLFWREASADGCFALGPERGCAGAGLPCEVPPASRKGGIAREFCSRRWSQERGGAAHTPAVRARDDP
jgi:hypothetical protein